MPLVAKATVAPAYTADMSAVQVAPQAALPPPPAAWLNRFAALGAGFATRLPAQGLPDPHWIAASEDCARLLGWPENWQQSEGALAVLSGNGSWPGMAPLASVYSGHQFGVWAGQLGDGRALLLGELDTPAGPMELQLKGAGLTPYSRMGDGRAVLRSSIREFLCSEAMHHLGIPTTRALCLTGSALPVRRERVETAAVVTRVAPSFIRFGHFEHFAHHGQPERLRQLVDFVIAHHYPACAEAPQPVLALLGEVTRRTARLLAQWQSVGFAHGVMNTDNMSILGLTIDYGPFGFLDAFDPNHICNHSDDSGRYAFARQPQVAWWNLHALAQALLPLVGSGKGEEADAELLRAELEPYGPAFSEAMTSLMLAKLGLQDTQAGDGALADGLLRLMAAQRADHTIAWRRLCDFSTALEARNDAVRDLFVDREAFDAWAADYTQRLRQEMSDDTARALRMRQANPKYVLRNHLAEQAIRQAEGGDFSEVQRLLKVLSRPFDEQPEHDADAGFPPDWAHHLEVSCSS
ncbi:YdiU family protein [Ideonella azotifigens]|uniref:Protein nucleotidyltransferase YdiU n=2 Tax=Ideonella azotifigens TaxID=513160 RepID=A0ABN1KD51_9BURK